MGIFVLNLATGLVIGLAFPGVANSTSVVNTNASDYEEHFNSTEIATSWSSTPFSGIPIIGDIFAGFNFLWQYARYIVDGFPMFLTWIKDSYISDAGGRFAFDVIANALRGLFALLISIFVIEYISGRYISD